MRFLTMWYVRPGKPQIGIHLKPITILKILININHFLNKNLTFYKIPIKIKIFRYQNIRVKYFANIRLGMF